MFRSTMCPASGEKTVFLRNLVLVILWTTVCYEPCIPDSHPHRITSTKCRRNTVVSPDDGHIVMKHVEIDKYTKNKLCTKLALFTSLLGVLCKNALSQWETYLYVINWRVFPYRRKLSVQICLPSSTCCDPPGSTAGSSSHTAVTVHTLLASYSYCVAYTLQVSSIALLLPGQYFR